MVNTNKLRGRIIEQGLNFEKLADIIGLSPSTLGRKVRNVSNMTLEEVEAICNALEIPTHRMMDYFFSSGKE